MWTIILEDGFAGDTVTVTVDGVAVYRADDVRTSPLLGHATSFASERARPGARVVVTLPARGVSAALVLPDSPARQVVAGMVGQRLVLTIPQTPRGYG